MTGPRRSNPLPPDDWLLAETTRRAEEAAGRFELTDPATLAARAVDGDIGRRIVERARRRTGGSELADAARRLIARLGLLPLVLLAAGLLAGLGAAGAVETRSGVIALSHALAVLLLAPTLLLLAWVGLGLGLPGGSDRRGGQIGARAGLPGRLGWQLMLPLLRRIGPGDNRHHLGAALAELGARRGKLLMAFATHAFWTAFFVGALVWLWLRFLGLRYDFSWETTLLSGDGMAWLIGALGSVPALLPGVDLPTATQIQAALSGHSPPGDRSLWARYLLGVLLVWGLTPRIVLALVFGWRWHRCRLGLDLGRAGYVRLLPALDGDAHRNGKRLGPAPPTTRFDPGDCATPGDGPPVMIGLELERNADHWPPDDAGAVVLGRADDRAGRHELHAALAALDPRPQRIIARCSARRTPDRGTGRWLAALRASAPVVIELEDCDPSPAGRIRTDDWNALASAFGLSFREVKPNSSG